MIIRPLPRVSTEEQSEAIHRRMVTLDELAEAVRALKRPTSPGLGQLVAEAHQNPRVPELDGFAGSLTEVLRTDKPLKLGGKV